MKITRQLRAKLASTLTLYLLGVQTDLESLRGALQAILDEIDQQLEQK